MSPRLWPRLDGRGDDGDRARIRLPDEGAVDLQLIPAYLFELDHHWRFALEWLRVEDNSYKRHDLSGGSPYATQTQLQLSVRYALGSQLR